MKRVDPPARPAARARRPAPARGANLIELMIGLTIGLMVVVAALATQVGVQLSAGTLSDRARLQDRADAVLRNIAGQAEIAGALVVQPEAAGAPIVRLVSTTAGIAAADAGGVSGLHVYGEEGGTSNPDSLAVARQHDPDGTATPMLECTGSTGTAAAGTTMQSVYTLNAQGLLRCTGTGASTATVTLAEGVEDFQVLYGLKDGAWTSRTLRWMTATAVTSGNLWPQVQALDLCVQLVGDVKGNPQVTDTRTGCRGTALPADGKLRVAARRVVVIRNTLLER